MELCETKDDKPAPGNGPTPKPSPLPIPSEETNASKSFKPSLEAKPLPATLPSRDPVFVPHRDYRIKTKHGQELMPIDIALGFQAVTRAFETKDRADFIKAHAFVNSLK